MEEYEKDEIMYRLNKISGEINRVVCFLEEIGFKDNKLIDENVVEISNKVDTLGMEILEIVVNFINEEN